MAFYVSRYDFEDTWDLDYFTETTVGKRKTSSGTGAADTASRKASKTGNVYMFEMRSLSVDHKRVWKRIKNNVRSKMPDVKVRVIPLTCYPTHLPIPAPLSSAACCRPFVMLPFADEHH